MTWLVISVWPWPFDNVSQLVHETAASGRYIKHLLDITINFNNTILHSVPYMYMCCVTCQKDCKKLKKSSS